MKLYILVLFLFLHAASVMSRVVPRQEETASEAPADPAAGPEETQQAAVPISIPSTSSSSRSSSRISSSSTSSSRIISTRSSSTISSRPSTSTLSTSVPKTTASSTTSSSTSTSTTSTDTTSADPAVETAVGEDPPEPPSQCDDSTCDSLPEAFQYNTGGIDRTCQACFTNADGKQQRTCGPCSENSDSYTLENGQYCSECFVDNRDGSSYRNSWDWAKYQCQGPPFIEPPSPAGRPNMYANPSSGVFIADPSIEYSCLGSGVPPADDRCYDYCNTMMRLSRDDATACTHTYFETYQTCLQCGPGSSVGGQSYNNYIPNLNAYCQKSACIDIVADAEVYGNACPARPAEPSPARGGSSIPPNGSGSSNPVTAGGDSGKSGNSAQAGANGSVSSAGQAGNSAGTALGQNSAGPIKTAAIKTVTNSNGQVLGTVVVDSSGKTASQVFAVSTTDAAGFPTLSFTTSTLTATFIPNTRFGVVLDSSTATSSAVRVYELPQFVRDLLFTVLVTSGSLQLLL